jgi:ribosomal protein L37AE/L43A
MSSDLAAFRDHARRMSTATHTPECPVNGRAQLSRFSEDGLWVCTGCVTDADRALWTRLADEVDAYLSDDDEGLFA